jgi:hypothetical protein
LTVEVVRFPVNDVNKASHSVIGSDGNLHCGNCQTQFLPDGLNGVPRVGSHSIQLVDKNYSWNMIPDHLLVNSDCLGLYAADSTQQQDGAVQDSQGSFDLNGEVDVAWGIDEVDVMIFPHQMSCG